MGLIQKAFEIVSRLPEGERRKITPSVSDSPKKKTSLLKKAVSIVDPEDFDLKPVEIHEFAELTDPTEDNVLVSEAQEERLSEIFQENDDVPLLDLDLLDSKVTYGSSEEDSELKEPSDGEAEFDDSLEQDVGDFPDNSEDVIDLDEWEEQLKKERSESESDDFLGKRETIDIGDGNESETSKDTILPEDVFDLNSSPEDVLNAWEEDAQKEIEKDLSLEDSLLEEISKEEPIEDFHDTLDHLEKEVGDAQKELSDLKEESETNQAEIDSLQKKLENYLVLVEITKDLVKSKNFEDFFDNLLYSIEGQIGPESILIFSRQNKDIKDLHPVANDGIDIESDFNISENDSIYKMISGLSHPIFARKLNTEKLSERDRLVIDNPYTEVVVPIFGDEEFLGFIVCGKLITGDHYTEQDLEFLKLISEIAGNFILKLYDFVEVREEVSHLNESVKLHEAVSSLSDALYGCTSFDAIYDELLDRMERDFGIIKFSLLLISGQSNTYKAFSSNLFSPETISRLSISPDSKLIPLISQVTGMYKIENFSSYTELIEQIPKHELDQMKEFSIFPLIHLGKLFGMLVVHEVQGDIWKPDQKQAIISISNVVSPVSANLILQTEKETFFKNPFNPVKEVVEKEIAKASQSGEKFTLVVLKILSVTRILNLLGPEFFRDYMDFIIAKLQTTIEEKDWISRVGEGKFAIFLQGRDKTHAEEFFTIIKKEFIKFPNPPKEFKLSIQLYSLTYPDQARDKRKFIEIIEDT